VTLRVGLFGGSFDPPHVGHLLLAVVGLDVAGFDQVWWVPLLHHAFGTKRPERFEDRAEMVRRLVAPYGERMRLEDIEAHRSGTSYTVDTVRELRGRHPDIAFHLLAGADVLAELHRWKDYEELLGMAPLVVFGRAGAPVPGGVASGVRLFPLELPEVSSTDLRVRLGIGAPVDHLLPARVAEVVAERRLYRGAHSGAAGASADPGSPGPPGRHGGLA